MEAPRPVTEAKVSASMAVTVIVEPDAETVFIPPPATTRSPVRELNELTPLPTPETVAQIH